MNDLQTRLLAAAGSAYKLRTLTPDDAEVGAFKKGCTFLEVCENIYAQWDTFLERSHKLMRKASLVDDIYDKYTFLEKLALPYPLPAGAPEYKPLKACTP